MKFGVAHSPHPGGGISIFVYEEDSQMWMSEILLEHASDMERHHSVDALIAQTVCSLKAQLRFNLEMPLADS